MKNTTSILLVLIFSLAFYACENDNNGGQENQDSDSLTVETLPDEIIVNEMPEDPENLATSSFGSRGLDIVKIGDPIFGDKFSVENANVRDTLFTGMMVGDSGEVEISWNAKIVEFEDGKIYMESSFDENKTLNRIRIETPKYKHFHSGLGVGSSAKELKAVYGDLFVRPFPEFGVIELMPNNHNIFHIEDKGYLGEDPDAWRMNVIPDDAKVVRVVVM